MPPPPAAEELAPRLFAGAALRLQPDKRLVNLVRQGYESAFEEIVRRYGTPLGRYAAGIVGGRSEDVTQDAFSKALLALRRDGAEIELRPWLYRIVRNTALNDLRDRPPAADALGEEVAGGRGPAEEVERREELAELTARLRALPEPQRAAIVMRELEGLGHDEIAAALGLSGGAVRQAIYRARQALRDGVGMLVPLPLLRWMLAAGAGPVETATGAAGAAGAGVALKASAVTALVAGAVGAGVALHGAHGTAGAPAAARAATVSRGPSSANSPGGHAAGERQSTPSAHGGTDSSGGRGGGWRIGGGGTTTGTGHGGGATLGGGSGSGGLHTASSPPPSPSRDGGGSGSGSGSLGTSGDSAGGSGSLGSDGSGGSSGGSGSSDSGESTTSGDGGSSGTSGDSSESSTGSSGSSDLEGGNVFPTMTNQQTSGELSSQPHD